MTRLGRRQLLGYAGAAGLGAVAGSGATAAVAGGSSPAPGAAGGSGPAGTSPYGDHQPGVTAPAPAATRVLSLDVRPGTDRQALGRLLRLWTGDVEALTQGRAAPGDTAPDLAQANVGLTVTVGLGAPVFAKAGLSEARPTALTAVPPMRQDRLEDRWSGGDLVLVVAADDDTSVVHAVRRLLRDAEPFASLRWEQAGSWRGVDASGRPATGRNLFGQVDGSGNLDPAHPLFGPKVWAQSPGWFAGGTTLVVRRIRMDLDRWDELTRDQQQRVIGRDLSTGAPLTGGKESDRLDVSDFRATDGSGNLVIPADAHARLSHPLANGGARIFRKGLNYTTEGPGRESGLVFMSYQADVAAQFTRIQRRLDRSDALNAWTTAIGSAEFAILPGFRPGGWLGESLLG